MLRGSSLCAATVGLASLPLAAASEGPLAREHPRVVPIGPALGESVLTPGNHGVLNQPLSGLPIKDILNLAREDKNNAISCLQMIKERLMSDRYIWEGSGWLIFTDAWKTDDDTLWAVILYCCDKQPYEKVFIDEIFKRFLYKDKLSEPLLEKLADKGIERAQEFYYKGLADGTKGITKNHEKLRYFAFAGIPMAQKIISEGYANGKYGFPENLAELIRLAESGWVPAQEIVARRLAYDERSFISLGNRRSHADGTFADLDSSVEPELREGCFSNQEDLERLKMRADSGWRPARELLSEAYLNGNYGIKPNHALLHELARKGWLEAKEALKQGTPKVEGCKTEPLLSGEARYIQILNPDFKKRIFTQSGQDLLREIIDFKIASL